MALNFGSLFGTLDLDSKDFDTKLGGVDSKLSGLVGVAKKAALGIAAGLAGGAVASVASFAGFESSMNEVFTLLPGISDKAMGQMTGQVKDFSKEFGVLPDKVVPALYQSLSAGVPQGNVFDFLEQAQKSAKAGVTDLTTAVNGITSTVNAYGAETLSASKASDLMFTAVRLGKTNFQELSDSLFQVNPVAAALGVKFGDVTAALAAMTAQGVPTSVATTQLRQMFVELSKEGTVTSATFKEIAGKSFKEFVAGGGNVQQALQLLEQHANKTGVGVNDLFGSVEAGSAALALTGKGTEKFTSSLAGMQQSAGATDAAYKTMDQGLSASFNRIKAAGAVFLLEVGDRLAPAAAAGADALLGVLGPAVSGVAPFFDTAGLLAGQMADFIGRNEGPMQLIAGLIAAVFIPGLVAMGVSATVNAATVVAAWVATQAGAIAAAAVHSAQVVAMVAKWLFMGAQSVVHAATVVASWVATSAGAVAAGVVMAAQVARQVAGWVLLGAQALLHAAEMAAAWVIAMGPVAWVTAAIVGLVVLIIANWDKVKQYTVAAWNAVVGFISEAGGRIVSAVTDGIGKVVGLYLSLPGRILSALGDLGSLLYNAGKDVIGGFIKGIKDMIPDVGGVLGGITSKLTSWKGPPAKDARILRPAGNLVMSGFIAGIDDKVGVLQRQLGAVTALVASTPMPTIGARSAPALAVVADAGSTADVSSRRVHPLAGSDPEEWGRRAVRSMGREALIMLRTA